MYRQTLTRRSEGLFVEISRRAVWFALTACGKSHRKTPARVPAWVMFGNLGIPVRSSCHNEAGVLQRCPAAFMNSSAKSHGSAVAFDRRG
jgi:hypothetical protein